MTMKNAREMMTSEVRTVTPELDVKSLAKRFAAERVSGFPVIDATGKLVGVVTESDLIHQNERLHIPTTVALFDSILQLQTNKQLEDELKRMGATTVAEIMSTDIEGVAPDATLPEIATLMGRKNVHTIPVIDDDKLVGVIGKLDLIEALAQ